MPSGSVTTISYQSIASRASQDIFCRPLANTQIIAKGIGVRRGKGQGVRDKGGVMGKEQGLRVIVTGTCCCCPYPLTLDPSPLFPLNGRRRLIGDVVNQSTDSGHLENGCRNTLDDGPRQARVLRGHAVVRLHRPDGDRRLPVPL